jgi:hypothetical protein
MKAATLLISVVVGAMGCAKQDPAPATQPSASAALQGGPRGGYGGPRGQGDGPRGPGGGAHLACPRGEGALTESARTATERALADERGSEAKYEAIERSLGPVMPFRRIERAERRHAWALEQLLVAHGAVVPAASSASSSVHVASVRDACALAVQSEKANIALYDELLKGDLPADARCVFGHLQAASRERHLPTFERCATGP